MGAKDAIMQVTYFLNAPMFNLLFYCYIILCWQNVTSYMKFNSHLTLDVQIIWEILAF